MKKKEFLVIVRITCILIKILKYPSVSPIGVCIV